MTDADTVVRFLHVLGAVLWVGGQLTLTLVVMPLARRTLPPDRRAEVLRQVGLRFGVLTGAVFLPVQIGTGVLLARAHGVTWASLAHPGYGRLLAAKLGLFGFVLAAAAVHGLAQGRGRVPLARGASMASLVGSLGIVLLATGLTTGPAPS
ncbi:MAG TPA: hypothetical protein VFX70_01885 [Mycobacteriales bacterium]|nr:hypothetical protein [Mycobacteriales bacterium]